MVSSSHPNQNLTLVEEITSQVAQRIPEWFGPEARLASAGPEVRWRRNSRASLLRYCVRAASGEQWIYVKVGRWPQQNEFAALQAIWQAVQAQQPAGLTAVRPLAYLSDYEAIVMDELAARSLMERLLQPGVILGQRAARERVEGWLQKAGAWLRFFHDHVGQPTDGFFPTETVRAELNAHLDRLEAATAGQLDVAHLRAATAAKLRLAQGTSVRCAALHGDFNTSNVLITRADEIAGIDIKRRSRAPVEFDLAELITDLHKRHALVLSQAQFLRATTMRLARNRAAVAHSYYGGANFNAAALDLYCVLSILIRWAGNEEAHADRSRRMPPWVTASKALMRRHLQRTTMLFLQPLDQSSG